jgi:hypothetical protein
VGPRSDVGIADPLLVELEGYRAVQAEHVFVRGVGVGFGGLPDWIRHELLRVRAAFGRTH